MKKYLSPVTIQIYESHSDPKTATTAVGSGLGLAPNGMRAISDISSQTAEDIDAKGYHVPKITMRNAKGERLGHFTMAQKERFGFDQLFIARAEVHMAFVRQVPESAVKWGKKVTEVQENNAGVKVIFDDESFEEADLVIGADGVRSVIREAVLGDGFEAEYQGLTGVGGFLPLCSLSQELRGGLGTDPVTMTFGPEGFFGYAPCTTMSPEPSDEDNEKYIMWWSTYEVSPAPDRNTAVADIHAQLIKRHGFWRLPYDSPNGAVYPSIINLACGPTADRAISSASKAFEKNVLLLPRYISPRLPRWCSPSGRIVLIGDSAHAMPPDSGQGVSCAVEDGLAVSILLRHHLSQTPTPDIADALKKTKTAYEAVRMPRIQMILDHAKRVGDRKKKQTWFQEKVRDWMIWTACRLPESLNDVGSTYQYDVKTMILKYLTKHSTPASV